MYFIKETVLQDNYKEQIKKIKKETEKSPQTAGQQVAQHLAKKEGKYYIGNKRKTNLNVR